MRQHRSKLNRESGIGGASTLNGCRNQPGSLSKPGFRSSWVKQDPRQQSQPNLSPAHPQRPPDFQVDSPASPIKRTSRLAVWQYDVAFDSSSAPSQPPIPASRPILESTIPATTRGQHRTEAAVQRAGIEGGIRMGTAQQKQGPGPR